MSAGLLISFGSEHELVEALGKLRIADIGEIETYTPKPLDSGPSIVPKIVLAAGLLGTVASFALQTYADTAAYPLNIGGRPNLSWPAFVPIAFENGILLAMLAGFFGFMIVNRLPRLYDPIDETAAIRRATRDAWCLAVHAQDTERVRHLLREFAPQTIEELP
jgi:hypothetical protein